MTDAADAARNLLRLGEMRIDGSSAIPFSTFDLVRTPAGFARPSSIAQQDAVDQERETKQATIDAFAER